MPKRTAKILAACFLSVCCCAAAALDPPQDEIDPWSEIEPRLPASQNPASAPASTTLHPTPDAPRGESAQQPRSIATNDDDRRTIARRGASRPQTSAAAPPAAAASGSWMRTWAALAGVVGLIALLAWGYRAFMGGALGSSLSVPGRPRHPGMIEVVSRVALSPKHSLCLVRIGPRLVLLGLGPDGIRTLDASQDAELAARIGASAAQNQAAADFRNALTQADADYDERDVPRALLQGARGRLSAALQRLRNARASANSE